MVSRNSAKLTTAPAVLQDAGAEPPNIKRTPMSSKLISDYLRKVAKIHSEGIGTAELGYRNCLNDLLKGLLPDVTVTEEPKRIKDCGAPDYLLTRDELTLGYVETKGLGARLDDDKYKEQFDRYRKALDNMIFTNYLEFQLWRGDKELMRVELAALQGNKIRQPPNDNFDQFVKLIKKFEFHDASTISSSHELALRMADKARLLAHVAEQALTDKDNQIAESRNLEELMADVKKSLIRDITPKKFADDVYAQTIAYGMFAARLQDQTEGGGGGIFP